MVISNNKVVSLIYELRKNSANGEVVEKLELANPMTFIFGTGNLLPKFEENINGLKVGESFGFGLSAQDAYGDVRDEAIVDVPISAFQVNGVLNESLVKIGNSIPMMDQDGNRLNGTVKDIDDNNVIMDFNHPMAGQDLFFKGEIVEVREATEEELSHGHLHGSGGGCGCDSGGCGSGDCGDSSCASDESSCGSGCGCH